MGRKELVLTDKEQKILETYAIYIPRRNCYDREGNVNQTEKDIETLTSELKSLNEEKSNIDLANSEEIKKIEKIIRQKRGEISKNKSLFEYQGIERLKIPMVYTSRRDVFWKNIRLIDGIYQYTIYHKESIKNDFDYIKIMFYIVFSSIIPIIKSNRQKKIKQYNRFMQMTNRIYDRKQPIPKAVSQIAFDVENIKYQFEVDRYNKGEFLYQNAKEIEADQLLFDFLLETLEVIKDSQNMDELMDKLSKEVVKFAIISNKKVVISNEFFIVHRSNKNYQDIMEPILANWNVEDDHKLRSIFLEIFDVKLSKELKDEILGSDSDKVDEEVRMIRNRCRTPEEIKLYLNNTYLKEKRIEITDKLCSLELLDSYFKESSEFQQQKLWEK